MERKNFVYIVQCRDQSLYTGWTTDLEERLKTHNGENGGSAAKYTRGRRPVDLVYSEEFETKSEALKRECAIKRLTRKKKWDLINSKREQE
ncbi:GIY-YIG nuclease family protein [Clostridium aminobutyricum]|uniref:GIY-YIG nuclease family protein n=1 Tax=Clostridium aminobutyricum TaxID=33953 RepID=A0A939D908_CLOAM|nr:GIY-YIG nuclease family protein [Clostridium aminobutyricum]MBN7773287.1 GIY-YIG nuclease family protein [Clostridium aminobutyricum]